MTIAAYIVRAATVKGWPAPVVAEAARRAEAAGSDRDDLLSLAGWLGSQPYPNADRIASIASTAAGAGRYRETAGSLASGFVSGVASDAAAVATGARSVASAAATGASRLARSPALVIAGIAAVAAALWAVRK